MAGVKGVLEALGTETAAVLASILEAADAAIFYVDARDEVRFANRRVRDFFGFDPCACVGRDSDALARLLATCTSAPEACLELLRRPVVDSGRGEHDELEVATPCHRHLRRYRGPVRDAAGALLGRIEVFSDHTSAVERSRLLEEQNRELDAFAASLAHDLKTPLVSLKGFAELLQREHGAGLDPRGRLYLSKIRSSALLLDEIIDGLRVLAGAAHGAECNAGFDPVPVLAMAAEGLAEEAAQRGVALELPDRAPEVECDRAKLFLMFQNLLSNGIRHSDPTRPNRWVRVQAERRGDGVAIRFADNGRGIDAGELSEVFRPFRRGHHASGPSGMGLGLAIVERLTHACRGRVEVESRPGEGSTFTVVLPARRPSGETTA